MNERGNRFCSGKRFNSVRIIFKRESGNYINNTNENREAALKEKPSSNLRCCRAPNIDRSQI